MYKLNPTPHVKYEQTEIIVPPETTIQACIGICKHVTWLTKHRKARHKYWERLAACKSIIIKG